MRKFSNFLDKIPFIGNKVAKNSQDEYTNNVEKQYNRALELFDRSIPLEAVPLLEQIADTGAMDPTYKQLACESLKTLGELYELGKFSNSKVNIDIDKAIFYYEKYAKLNDDGDMLFKLGKMLLDRQNFSKAITYLERAAACGIKPACMTLGGIYEEGLNKVDQFGNKSDFVVPIDLDKAKIWYERLAKQGDSSAQAAMDRVEYTSTHTDSIQFEEKDKIYTQIAEKRKAKGIEMHFKSIEASKLQYQYIYIHNQVEGYIHKLPKDWIMSINVDTEEEYYAPSHTYTDFNIYVSYDSLPKESTRTLKEYVKYQNEAFDEDLNFNAYVTEYADGICTTYYHKDMEKGIVTFGFQHNKRLTCLRFVCATMDIIEQYEEIIFEIANSFAFVNPTLVSTESANRREHQYYREAVYYYYMGDYEQAMNFARQALKEGSRKASYLLIELYFDEDSPYRNVDKALNFAKQLYNANKDSDLAFLIGNIYDQQMKDYTQALNWYEEANKLNHQRVPFYLGRLYYYGVLKTKRNGELALEYFSKALQNGIYEADAYIRDIKELNGADLQATVDEWEQAIKDGLGDIALKVANKKKDQVFYLASDTQIEDAYKTAYRLGKVEAAYELGILYRNREADENYRGDNFSMYYLEKAFDEGFNDFSKELLFDVITTKSSKTSNVAEKFELYLRAAKEGYVKAVEKIIEYNPELNDTIKNLYETLRKHAIGGDDESLTSMWKLEKKFMSLLALDHDDSKKIIENKFFRLAVPKECTPVINDEGGTIRFADSVVEFAVAEMPIQTDKEEDYLKVYRLIVDEYSGDDNSKIIVANSRMIGSAMLSSKGNSNTFSILLISSKNQYLFKLSSFDRRELMVFKDKVMEIAESLIETGEIYVATGDKANKNIGLTLLLSANENGMLSINKDED